jgi:hypothetical protein
MGIGKNILQGVRSLFGKSESNQSPNNLDIIQFNSATDEWELVSAVVGQAVQSSSNVGSGEGVAKPRIGDDLPFRSLTTTSKISLTGSADEIEIDIGTLLISDIQGLQTALDNLEPPFLISDITGLQTALDSKIETLTNVGGEKEIAKTKVGQDVPIRTLKEGTNITITQNADDLEISSIDTGEVNTASNVGTGVNVFLAKVLQDLEFRSLLANAEILITQNALDLAFSIGAIAQSKITGLVSALLTKIETLTNVGTGAEIAKAKVGVNVDLRKINAGTNISVVQNADDITINNTAIPPAQETKLHIDVFARDDARNWGNMPLAITEIFGRLSLRSKTDLDNFTQARLVVNIDTIGAVGADLHAEYDAGSGFLELADVANAGDVLIDTLGTLLILDSGWFDVDALALVTDVTLRIVGENGDGATDPRFGHISLEFRT